MNIVFTTKLERVKKKLLVSTMSQRLLISHLVNKFVLTLTEKREFFVGKEILVFARLNFKLALEMCVKVSFFHRDKRIK